MQQVDFKCPHCTALIKAPPSLEGEYGECPKCKKDVDRWPAPISRPQSQPVVTVLPAGPKPPTQAAVWFYMAGDKQRGPVTEAQLKALAEAGSLRATDLVWRDGMPGWVAASWLPGLFPQSPPTHPPAVSPPQPLAVVARQPSAVTPPTHPQPLVVAQAQPVPTDSRETKECPFCSEIISIRAKKCPICHETVDVAMRAAEEAQREAEDARREAEDARRESRRNRGRREVHYHESRPRPQCPHLMHLLLTIFTAGLWLPIWIIHAIIVESS